LAFPESLNVLVLDNGSFHKSSKLFIPDNIRLVFTPPYTPEVNPIERVWQHFKDSLARQYLLSIDTLSDYLTSLISSTLPSTLSSLTSFPFFASVANAFL